MSFKDEMKRIICSDEPNCKSCNELAKRRIEMAAAAELQRIKDELVQEAKRIKAEESQNNVIIKGERYLSFGVPVYDCSNTDCRYLAGEPLWDGFFGAFGKTAATKDMFISWDTDLKRLNSGDAKDKSSMPLCCRSCKKGIMSMKLIAFGDGKDKKALERRTESVQLDHFKVKKECLYQIITYRCTDTAEYYLSLLRDMAKDEGIEIEWVMKMEYFKSLQEYYDHKLQQRTAPKYENGFKKWFKKLLKACLDKMFKKNSGEKKTSSLAKEFLPGEPIHCLIELPKRFPCCKQIKERAVSIDRIPSIVIKYRISIEV